jgi:hypothetical protein
LSPTIKRQLMYEWRVAGLAIAKAGLLENVAPSIVRIGEIQDRCAVLLKEHEVVIDGPGVLELRTQRHLSLQHLERTVAQLDLTILARLGPILLAAAHARLLDSNLPVHKIAIRCGQGDLLGLPEPGGGATGAVSGIAGRAGGIVSSGVAASGGAMSRYEGAVGGLEGTGHFASGSRGVFALKNIALSPTGEANGSALTSSTGIVRLDRGTCMLLVTRSAAGNADAGLSKGATGATSQAAAAASGSSQVTQQPAQKAAPAHEPADRR